jgi:hypothetical protein
MLHREVMSLVLGRRLGCDEFVCHRDDDPRNNWPENLYLGDPLSNAFYECPQNLGHQGVLVCLAPHLVAQQSAFKHVAPHSIDAVRLPRSRVAGEPARWG